MGALSAPLFFKPLRIYFLVREPQTIFAFCRFLYILLVEQCGIQGVRRSLLKAWRLLPCVSGSIRLKGTLVIAISTWCSVTGGVPRSFPDRQHSGRTCQSYKVSRRNLVTGGTYSSPSHRSKWAALNACYKCTATSKWIQS